jgi:uncharacterized protein with von Willebrand factor type A (vWA) domain
MLPHVDEFLPAHNIDSLVALGKALAAAPARRPDATRAAA